MSMRRRIVALHKFFDYILGADEVTSLGLERPYF